MSKNEELKGYAQEYLDLRKRKSEIEKRMKEVSELLKAYAIDYGTKNSTGSSYCDFGDVIVGNQAKKSVKLNENKATEFFKSIGQYENVIEVKEVISEEKIETLLAEGIITEDDISQIVDVKTSYAVDIKAVEKEEVAEVEVASRTKPKKQLPMKKK